MKNLTTAFALLSSFSFIATAEPWIAIKEVEIQPSAQAFVDDGGVLLLKGVAEDFSGWNYNPLFRTYSNHGGDYFRQKSEKFSSKDVILNIDHENVDDDHVYIQAFLQPAGVSDSQRVYLQINSPNGLTERKKVRVIASIRSSYFPFKEGFNQYRKNFEYKAVLSNYDPTKKTIDVDLLFIGDEEV